GPAARPRARSHAPSSAPSPPRRPRRLPDGDAPALERPTAPRHRRSPRAPRKMLKESYSSWRDCDAMTTRYTSPEWAGTFEFPSPHLAPRTSDLAPRTSPLVLGCAG